MPELACHRKSPEAAKTAIWVGSALRDLKEFPAEVRHMVGFALFEAQKGGKHQDAKVLKGFGGAGVLEVVSDHDGDTFRMCLHGEVPRDRLRSACLSEEIEEGNQNSPRGA